MREAKISEVDRLRCGRDYTLLNELGDEPGNYQWHWQGETGEVLPPPHCHDNNNLVCFLSAREGFCPQSRITGR